MLRSTKISFLFNFYEIIYIATAFLLGVIIKNETILLVIALLLFAANRLLRDYSQDDIKLIQVLKNGVLIISVVASMLAGHILQILNLF